MKLAFNVVLENLKKEEGFCDVAYKDTVGKLTIGYGRNLQDRGITQEEAEYLLSNDIKSVDSTLFEQIPVYSKLSPARQYVIISMCFNLGLTGILKFRKMWKAISENDFQKASLEMLDSKWASQVRGRALKLSNIMRTGDMQ